MSSRIRPPSIHRRPGRRATGRSLPGAAWLAAVALVVLAPAAMAGDVGSGLAGAMLARPLFSPTRRPPAAPVAPVLQPLAPPVPSLPSLPSVVVSGVIVGPGGGVVLVRGPLDPAPVRVRLGGTVDGWTVAEIRPRAVVLHRDGRSATVDLTGADH